jgi:hypothetical protein
MQFCWPRLKADEGRLNQKQKKQKNTNGLAKWEAEQEILEGAGLQACSRQLDLNRALAPEVSFTAAG